MSYYLCSFHNLSFYYWLGMVLIFSVTKVLGCLHCSPLPSLNLVICLPFSLFLILHCLLSFYVPLCEIFWIFTTLNLSPSLSLLLLWSALAVIVMVHHLLVDVHHHLNLDQFSKFFILCHYASLVFSFLCILTASSTWLIWILRDSPI